jgi:hypothetical protein
MKKLIGLVLFIIVFCNSGQAARIIQPGEIASWYLNADLVLICNVTHTDTYTISKFDSLVDNGYHLRYNTVREKYKISIDSIIKGEQLIDGKMDTIFTPLFSTDDMREKTEFTGLNSEGDSVFTTWFEVYTNFDDYSYFRIESPQKRLVILRKTDIGYVVDYETECDSWILDFLEEVKMNGGYYFPILTTQSLKSETALIYPNPCSDVLHINGIQAKRIEITDFYGKTQRVEIHDPYRIDLSGVKPGVYIISIFTDNKIWTEKIIKE